MPEISCQTCNKSFHISPSRIERKKRFCSFPCKKVWVKEWLSKGDSTHPRWQGGPLRVICKTCNKAFSSRRAVLTRAFCGNRCKTIYQLHSNPKNGTLIERSMEQILISLDVPYEKQFNFFNRYSCDFALPYRRIVIECDGDYWHSLPSAKTRDATRDSFMRSKGWQVFRFKEHDFKQRPEYVQHEILRIA